MRRSAFHLILAACVAVLAASPAVAEDLRTRALNYFAPLPDRIDMLRDRPVTPEKVTLGQMLFFDPRLSESGQVACASCHNPATGGDGNRSLSIGHAWQGAPQNAPTIFNATLNSARFWQGWDEDLRREREYLLETASERTASADRVVSVLTSMPDYVRAFEQAFPGQADPVTFANYAAALEQFETTLLTPAPFDDWLRGDDMAMSQAALEGLELFMGTGCSTCHSGVNLGGDDYYAFRVVRLKGTEDQPETAACFTVEEKDGAEYLYRAGSLRNIALTAPYFSEGSVWALPLAVELMARSQLSEELRDDEVDRIVAFLESLTGRPPDLTLPVLPAETSLTPKPPVSQPDGTTP